MAEFFLEAMHHSPDDGTPGKLTRGDIEEIREWMATWEPDEGAAE